MAKKALLMILEKQTPLKMLKSFVYKRDIL